MILWGIMLFPAFLLDKCIVVNDIYFIVLSNKKKIFATLNAAKRNLRLPKILTESTVDLHDNKLSSISIRYLYDCKRKSKGWFSLAHKHKHKHKHDISTSKRRNPLICLILFSLAYAYAMLMH